MINLKKHFVFISIYITFLLTGIFIFNDYGVSWDEDECRIDMGIRNLDFIRTGDEEPLLKSVNKYHGPAFEIVLIAFEKIIEPDSMHNIFLLRHFITFVLFAISVVFFYLLCVKSFGSIWYGLLGVVMYILSQRIFADAFYNSKDLGFLSFLVIAIYYLIIFLESRKSKHAILCAIFTGIMIDIRIMGIILPAIMFLIIAFDFIRSPEQRHRILISSLLFLAVLVVTIIAFWPVLWLGPLKHFILAWKESSRYPWHGNVLFEGKISKSIDLPWYYAFKWMLITIPPLYLALFITGISVIIRNLFSGKFPSRIILVSFWLITVSMISIIVLQSVLYDGWRHLYFLFPPMVIIGVFGFKSVTDLITVKRMRMVAASIVVYFCTVIMTMAELHPFENVYFNAFAHFGSVPVKDRYEVEYWALSYRQAMEHILETDTSKNILLFSSDGKPGTDNMNFLPVESQERISITDKVELADYYLTIHRNDRKYSSYEPSYHIMRNDLIIHSIYDLRNNRVSLSDENVIKKLSNNLESENEQFHPFHIMSDPVTGNKFEQMEEKDGFGVNLLFTVDSSLLIKDRKYYAEFRMKSRSEKNSHFVLIFQVDESSFWKEIHIQSPKKNRWNKYRFIQEMPEFKAVGDAVKIHLGNPNHVKVDIDDIEVKIFCVPIDDVNKALSKLPS